MHLFSKVIALIACTGLAFTCSVHAENYLGDGIISPGENEMEELARAVQNPLASMISLPFQLNTNFMHESTFTEVTVTASNAADEYPTACRPST